MSVVEGLKIQIHVCGTYVLSVWFTLLIGFGSVWIFSRAEEQLFYGPRKTLLQLPMLHVLFGFFSRKSFITQKVLVCLISF